MQRAVTWLRREGESLDFRWRPALVVIVFILVWFTPVYWKGDLFYDALRAIGGEDFLRAARKIGFTHTVALRLTVPTLVLILARERLRDFGVGLGNVRAGLRITGVFYALYVPCFIFLMLNDSFIGHYKGVAQRYDTWGEFMLYEVASVAVLMIAGEYFFRGFLLFGVARSYGAFAGILVHLIPYVYGHHTKVAVEAFGSLPIGFALGWLAIRTKSIWYGIILHATIALGFNALLFARGH